MCVIIMCQLHNKTNFDSLLPPGSQSTTRKLNKGTSPE